MRIVVASLVAMGLFTLPGVVAGQARSSGTAPSGGGACSLLPRALVEKVLGDSVNKILLGFPPEEKPIGTSGSACHYAGITLQIDAMTSQQLEGLRKKSGQDWVSAPGIGDSAYFRNNQNLFAEVLGRSGTRTFSVLMGIQKGGIEKVKPNVIALAQAIVPKLR